MKWRRKSSIHLIMLMTSLSLLFSIFKQFEHCLHRSLNLFFLLRNWIDVNLNLKIIKQRMNDLNAVSWESGVDRNTMMKSLATAVCFWERSWSLNPEESFIHFQLDNVYFFSDSSYSIFSSIPYIKTFVSFHRKLHCKLLVWFRQRLDTHICASSRRKWKADDDRCSWCLL